MRGRSTSSSPHRIRRRGLALLSALVCVVVLAALSLTLTRTVLARVREAELHHQRLQADALAESAYVRAQSQWRANPDWTGEIWSPKAEGLFQLQAEIRVPAADAEPQLHVVSQVSAGPDSVVRVERRFPWPPAPKSQVANP